MYPDDLIHSMVLFQRVTTTEVIFPCIQMRNVLRHISSNEILPCIQMKNASQRIFSDESRVSECLWVQVAFLNTYGYDCTISRDAF